MIIYACLLWIGIQLHAPIWYNVLVGLGIFINVVGYGLRMYQKGKNA